MYRNGRKMADIGLLYWITGLSGAGKTTIGNRLYYELKKSKDNVVLLDGDIIKGIVNDEVGYSEKERRKRAMKYAKLCKMLTDQDIIVICCTIAMYDEVRVWNKINNKRYVEIFLNVPLDILRERDQKGLYTKFEDGEEKNILGLDLEAEFPKEPNLEFCNDGKESIESIVNKILKYEPEYSSNFDRDVKYWDLYYAKRQASESPSPFAQWILPQLIKQKSILDLGCGNGRDSIFFNSNGMIVTAVDASPQAIKILESKTKRNNICFICDDFVCSSMLFAGQYDYCYSRFSLHAINKEQEIEVIGNVFKVLKDGGKFFIETRSVADEIYGEGVKVGEDSYYYNGHFRRFIRKECLIKRLKEAGFEIEYEKESRGFAPWEGADPFIIRIVARKRRCKGRE